MSLSQDVAKIISDPSEEKIREIITQLSLREIIQLKSAVKDNDKDEILRIISGV